MSPAWALCREARRRGGLSQRELAARAGVSPSTIARIEKARIEPTLDLLMRVVHACGLELRLHLTPRVLEDEPMPTFDIDRRLGELKRLSALALEARRDDAR